jgi:hypothetical protein
MDSSPGEDGRGKTGGPITGWVIGYDGWFDAVESWQHVLDAGWRSLIDEADSTPTAADVAREMLEVNGNEGMAAVRAAEVLEKRFENFDRQDRQRRRQEFQGQVQQEFSLAAEELSPGVPRGYVVLVLNLAARVSAEMLRGTFEQIGIVLDAGIKGEDWGWVKFELAEEAEEAVQRFGGVELDGQPMECRMYGGERDTRTDY